MVVAISSRPVQVSREAPAAPATRPLAAPPPSRVLPVRCTMTSATAATAGIASKTASGRPINQMACTQIRSAPTPDANS